jgi:hypothetical protein
MAVSLPSVQQSCARMPFVDRGDVWDQAPDGPLGQSANPGMDVDTHSKGLRARLPLGRSELVPSCRASRCNRLPIEMVRL